MEKTRTNRRKEKKDKSSQAVKIVVRHLPPTMTEEEFLEQVDPLPEIDSYYYCPADWSLGQEATCRAYIDMSLKDIAEVLQFRDRFDGYVFVDSKGAEYVAIVEYAPFQCFMKNKARNHDNKVNTIEKESHYQEFLQKLTEEREEATRLGDLKIDFTIDNRSDEKVKSTPLLQYLANKKEKRREEARKRNEEKRKQREEQKLLRLIEPSENSKPKDSANENKKSNNNSNQKKGANKAEGGGSEEPNKNSRSKRRTERDQRRREEHEQRKLARDREQRDKKKNDKDNPAQNSTKQTKEHQKAHKEIVILKKETTGDVSTNKSADASNERLQTNAENKEPTKNPFKSKDNNRSSKALTENTSKSNSQEKTHSSNSRKSASSRAAEDRRIRNKDRPSIAIYQPKVRMRLGSEENSPNGSKDCPSATEAQEGDCVLPEEKPKSKRFGRRNKQKHQDKKDSAEHARCVSKSSESSTSAHSTTLK